ncbi:unnamed protein product [Vitrella brassicaformis CCMP3155]|uniref:Uncharacterized protein n=1 Tax=Vitrella brassicaformis (strain CCMP3155) TaxID=1169540 RepID=A0A0G4EQH7_VITBC|nr:unnamed protein product [Vitrella brassicaformis CCMP3155]|eukprot:CEL99890.1 unnamed protein product [Vitrella brassicaformis CCMP3155]
MGEVQERMMSWYHVYSDTLPQEIQFEGHFRVNPDDRPDEFFADGEGFLRTKPIVFYREVSDVSEAANGAPVSARENSGTAVVVRAGPVGRCDESREQVAMKGGKGRNDEKVERKKQSDCVIM